MWTPLDGRLLRPWVLACIEAFGVDASFSAPTGRSIACSAPTRTSSMPTRQSRRLQPPSSSRCSRATPSASSAYEFEVQGADFADATSLSGATANASRSTIRHERRQHRRALAFWEPFLGTGALAHGPRPALSRKARRLPRRLDRRRVRRAPGGTSSSCSIISKRSAPTRRRPRTPAISIFALASRTQAPRGGMRSIAAQSPCAAKVRSRSITVPMSARASPICASTTASRLNCSSRRRAREGS